MTNQWIEIDSARLSENMRVFRRRIGNEAILAPVVKSNGYGHGIETSARAFLAGGADWLCVHAFGEARRLLAAGASCPILVLGPLAEDEVVDAVRSGVHVTVTDAVRLAELEAAASEVGREAQVHLKVETGTHRQGVDLVEFERLLSFMRDRPGLELVGVHSHFANIEDTTRHEYAALQMQRFDEALARAEALGMRPRLRHIASSAATLIFPHTHYDLVRPGIAAYGYWPSRETLVSVREQGLQALDLRPALGWKSRITQLKPVAAGSYVGYGCSERLERDTRLAIVPVGYADGYRRSMSSRAHVLVQGRRCPVRGRICMNLIMVDVGHLPEVEVQDEVVLLGPQLDEEITAEQMAEWAGTIHYEILAGLSPDLPRRQRPEAV